jgi:dolichol-phosphate mannosyltransferase
MDASGTRLLCIIVPCFDEEQVVESFHAELKRALELVPRWRHLIYFVDDGSRDTTLLHLRALERRDECTRVLSLSRNFGHQIAITAGLDHADRRADAVLVMDADLENPPALIPKLIEQWERGHDVVMGVRETGRVVGWWRRGLSRAFYAVFNRVSDVSIAAGAPDFFLLSRRAREALARMGDQRRLLRAMVAWIGFSRAYVPYVPPARLAGRSKYTLTRMLRLASDAFFAFSSAPLMLIGGLGITTFLVGALLLVRALLAADGTGMSWLPGLLCMLSGMQLAAVGLVGGYVGRIFEHSQGRPLYIVSEAPEETNSEPKVLEVAARVSRRARSQ